MKNKDKDSFSHDMIGELFNIILASAFRLSSNSKFREEQIENFSVKPEDIEKFKRNQDKIFFLSLMETVIMNLVHIFPVNRDKVIQAMYEDCDKHSINEMLDSLKENIEKDMISMAEKASGSFH